MCFQLDHIECCCAEQTECSLWNEIGLSLVLYYQTDDGNDDKYDDQKAKMNVMKVLKMHDTAR